MKKSSILLAISLAVSSAGTAMAEPGKWYAGIGAGQSHYENWASKTDITQLMDEFGAGIGVDDFQGNRNADSDGHDFAIKLFAGYSFDERLALEVSYIDMGEVEASSRASGSFFDPVDNQLDGDLFARAKASVEAITLDASLNYPLTPVVAFIGRAGIYVADTELQINAGSSFDTETYDYAKTESSIGLHFSIGLNFRVTSNIKLRAEWEQLDQVEANNGKTDVDLLSVAMTYGFD